MCGYCIMARKTRRQHKKEVVADAVNPHAKAVVAAVKRWCCLLRFRSQYRCCRTTSNLAKNPRADGGRRRRKTAKGGKKKLNEFFKLCQGKSRCLIQIQR